MPTAAERYHFAEVEIHGKNFISDLLKLCKVYHVEDVKQENMMKIGNKDVFANQLVCALKLIERQQMLIIDQKVHVSAYQKDVIKLQSDVINSQKKTMDDFMLHVTEELTAELSKTVQDTVQTGFSKSYSEAAQSNVTSSQSPVITQETLKTVAKQVIAEEELSKNVMVFNLPEEDNEDVCEKLAQVFQYLGEKPKIEARRLGNSTKKSVRPVKVTMSSASMVQQVLAKSSKLRSSDNYKTVFLSPDRTDEQRTQQRKLVLELKRKKTDTGPGWRHFIKDGQICSVETDTRKPGS